MADRGVWRRPEGDPLRFVPGPHRERMRYARGGRVGGLPPWVAVMVQLPGARVVAVAPETVQTAGVAELKDTGRLEVAEAVRVTGVPTWPAAGVPKSIVCAVCRRGSGTIA